MGITVRESASHSKEEHTMGRKVYVYNDAYDHWPGL